MVDPEILLHKLKLHHNTENTLNLFRSYLLNRKQVVQVGDNRSNILHISPGVHHGSILGLLLFIIYINDLTLSCAVSDIELYADDSTLYKSGSNINEIQNNLQFSLKAIESWCKLNNMALHTGKSKCMVVIGSQQRLKTLSAMYITINNTAFRKCHMSKDSWYICRQYSNETFK